MKHFQRISWIWMSEFSCNKYTAKPTNKNRGEEYFSISSSCEMKSRITTKKELSLLNHFAFSPYHTTFKSFFVLFKLMNRCRNSNPFLARYLCLQQKIVCGKWTEYIEYTSFIFVAFYSPRVIVASNDLNNAYFFVWVSKDVQQLKTIFRT